MLAMERLHTIELIEAAARSLVACGVESSRLDAQILMVAASGLTRADVIAGARNISAEQAAHFQAMVARRMSREPIAYIVGHKEFYSIEFEVNQSVLIPRPETELLVAAALESIAHVREARVLDIGTGSGAIAISIAVNAPQASVVATDISADVLEIANRNAFRHGVGDRVTLRRANCFEALDAGPQLGRFDLIVSNPPYVAEADLAHLEPEVRSFEPNIALIAGQDGLDFYRLIAAGAREHLHDAADLIIEVGAGQAPAVAKIFQERGFEIAGVLDDLGGLQRVVHARTESRK
jgi:release factor glutamine methyltransferase